MTERVMVPVPEELEERVRHYVTWRLAGATDAGWSAESVAAVWSQLDAPSRAVLSAVARAVVDDEPVSVAGVAGTAGATTREVLGIVLELVHRFKALGGPTFPLLLLDPPEGQQDDQRLVIMPRDGAALVVGVAGPA